MGCYYYPPRSGCITHYKCKYETYESQNDSNFKCPQLQLTIDFGFICVPNNTSDIYACKEIPNFSCSDVPEIPSNSNAKCKYFPVSINSNETHTCTSDNNGRCKEEYKCNKVPKGENIDCSSYPVSDDFAYIV